MDAKLLRRIEMVGGGYPPLYPVVMFISLVAVTVIAVVQRLPLEPPFWALLGATVGAVSLVVDLVTLSSIPCAVFAMLATALFLGDPVPIDFAPMLLVLNAAIASAMESLRLGLALSGVSVALVVVAGQLDHLDAWPAYVLAISIGWLVGYMVLSQKRLAENEVGAQRARADRAAGDERRRIAREVHDVIAHSLSITVLNVTGARRALEEGATDEAMEALADAERLGRQAMTEIRYIVKVLGSDDESAAPTPDAADIDKLVAEYRKAGIDVSLDVTGDPDTIPGAIGSALYRITQESLANVVKHAGWPSASVELIAGSDIVLRVENPCDGKMRIKDGGSGIGGMKQRAQLLGGFVDTVVTSDTWVVTAVFPAEHATTKAVG